MPTTNYFKAAGEAFFFDDNDETATLRAWRAACERRAHHPKRPPISFWRRPTHDGPWRSPAMATEIGSTDHVRPAVAEA